MYSKPTRRPVSNCVLASSHAGAERTLAAGGREERPWEVPRCDHRSEFSHASVHPGDDPLPPVSYGARAAGNFRSQLGLFRLLCRGAGRRLPGRTSDSSLSFARWL